MYYLLFYEFAENYLERRTAFREEHLALARAAHEGGDLVMAGALSDPADGAVLIFQGTDSSAAEVFVANDPYVKNGLVLSHKIRPWTVVFGGKE